jgi:hypothetical protein
MRPTARSAMRSHSASRAGPSSKSQIPVPSKSDNARSTSGSPDLQISFGSPEIQPEGRVAEDGFVRIRDANVFVSSQILRLFPWLRDGTTRRFTHSHHGLLLDHELLVLLCRVHLHQRDLLLHFFQWWVYYIGFTQFWESLLVTDRPMPTLE